MLPIPVGGARSPEPHRKDTRPLSVYCWSTVPIPMPRKQSVKVASRCMRRRRRVTSRSPSWYKGAVPEHWVDSSGDSLFASQQHPRILHLLYSYGGTMELQVYAATHRIDVIAEVLKLAPSR